MTGTGGAATGGSGGGTTTATCTEPPAAGPLLGWASQPGAGYNATSVSTTTGGGNATPATVTSLSALNSAAGGTTAAVIYVKGVMVAGTVKVGSNKTIAGVCGAEIHGHVDMSGSVNVIFRNLKVVGYNCSDSPSECKSGADAITVVSSAHHIWFDHCDICGHDGSLHGSGPRREGRTHHRRDGARRSLSARPRPRHAGQDGASAAVGRRSERGGRARTA